MEHVWRVAEAVLAIFGSMKFMHECYEVISHLVHLIRK
jgi:hypothetical protein